jgi:hypothetical protein
MKSSDGRRERARSCRPLMAGKYRSDSIRSTQIRFQHPVRQHNVVAFFLCRGGSLSSKRQGGVCTPHTQNSAISSLYTSGIISGKDLYGPQVRILAILVILQNAYLYHESSQNRSLTPIDLPVHVLVLFFILVLLDRSHVREINVNPPSRLLKAHLCEFLHIVSSHARQKLYLRRSVRFVGLEVEEDADEGYGDKFEEVQCQ